MGRVQGDIELEVNLLCGKLVCKLCIELLELAPCMVIRDLQGIAERLEDAARLLPLYIGSRRKALDGLDDNRWIILRLGKEADGAANLSQLFLICPQPCRMQDGICKALNPSKVGIVRPRPIDDKGIQFLVSDGGAAEQVPKLGLGIGAVLCQPVHKLVHDAVKHVRFASMGAVVVDCLPDVCFCQLDFLLKFHEQFSSSIQKAMDTVFTVSV